MKTILIVEDEKDIQEMMSIFLGKKGYLIEIAEDYFSALDYINSSKPLDLILLDWMIPKGSGLNLIDQLKSSKIRESIPVIMVSARISIDDKIMGLNKGADDFITKPFSLKELQARVEAHLRRTTKSSENNNIIEKSGIKIDRDARRLYIDQQEISVRRIEFNLLSFLIRHTDKVYSRQQLLDHIWGIDNYVDERTVDVSIGRLRKILEPSGHDKYLQTIRGEGYRFSFT